MSRGATGAPRGRRQLLLLALLFAVPPLLAAFLYFSGWRSESTVNRGELINPPRPLADVALVSLDGEPRRFSSLNGRWSLVQFGPAACGTTCERQLYTMRQARAALGADAERVQRVLVLTDLAGRDALRIMLRENPDIIVLAGPPEAVSALAGQFAAAGTGASAPDLIYLVDPLGNLMMHYGPQAGSNDLRKDLARLLRLSRVG